jgi:hypothetical protein
MVTASFSLDIANSRDFLVKTSERKLESYRDKIKRRGYEVSGVKLIL